MSKKQWTPIVIGLGAVVLILIAGALFFSGNEEGAAGLGLAAAGAAEMARRRRAGSMEELDEIADEATEETAALGELLDEAEKEMAKSDEAVADTSLSDLVKEEKERDS